VEDTGDRLQSKQRGDTPRCHLINNNKTTNIDFQLIPNKYPSIQATLPPPLQLEKP